MEMEGAGSPNSSTHGIWTGEAGLLGDFSYNLVRLLILPENLWQTGALKNLVGGAYSAFNVCNLNH